MRYINRTRRGVGCLGILGLLALATSVGAAVKLPALFSDHAVFQADQALPVWGWADAGEDVVVSLGDQTAKTTAEASGQWRVRLKPLSAGGPYTMTVTGTNQVEVKNILIGEVWLCGGQSNMQWTVSNSNDAETEIAAATYPMIRLFKVKVEGADTPQEDVIGEWVACSPETIPGFSAVGYYFGRHLRTELDRPIGLIQSCLGGTNASSWVTRDVLSDNPAFHNFLDNFQKTVEAFPKRQADYEAKLAAWEAARDQARKDGAAFTQRAPQPPMGPTHVKRPNALYNAMIAPLVSYAIQGVIWYQGEANAGTPESARQYASLFPALIRNWREQWGQGDFPFLFVQLAAWDVAKGDGWPLLREAQSQTLALKNTGQAVAIDVGHPTDIHPKDKQTVGYRLALAALNIAYGRDGVYSGPVYVGRRVDGDRMDLLFDHAGSGLMVKGDALKGFTICGPDRVFHPAQATIVAPGRVEVYSPKALQPEAVRYGWAPYPECNLYNKEGLPASPFRTDRYPIEGDVQ